MNIKNNQITPFLKWAGGKRQLIQSIIEFLPNNIEKLKYIEPFIGGGALFFYLKPKNAIINDFNEELVNTYKTIRDNIDELINELSKHKNEPAYYYHIRGLDRNDYFKTLNNVQRASRVIYLNKTCFNGLYRVNKAGQFNTPFGNYKNPAILNEELLRKISNYLNTNNIIIENEDYHKICNIADSKSFVYLDPPYHPITKSSSFTSYVGGGWHEKDQIRLKETCDKLNNKKIKFLLSNSSVPFIHELYREYNINIISANRVINSNGENRGKVNEVLVSNY